ncbi:MAG TPA: multidrug transporter [Methylophilaceae bacterium]|nr:multidrug transporter [Methylophilaceae bacterium]HAJ72006.1 multidrug transporter [Methylophilaceae bacterium]
MKWLILVLGILSNASASVLVKMAMVPPRKFPSIAELIATPLTVLSNWPFWLGLGLYGAAFLLYAAALSKLPLNVAHPILTAGAVATVALFSVIIFKESFYWTTALGIVFVIIGVTLISSRVG